VGRTVVDVGIENFADVLLHEATGNGRKKTRKLQVRAVVDTGSALLCLHRADIRKLGLRFEKSGRVRTTNGEVERPIYTAARISILDRQCLAEVMEIPDNAPPLLGYILLESLDLVVHAKSNKVILNPESGGQFTLDLL
jgi:predicted aspartyl protease